MILIILVNYYDRPIYNILLFCFCWRYRHSVFNELFVLDTLLVSYYYYTRIITIWLQKKKIKKLIIITVTKIELQAIYKRR